MSFHLAALAGNLFTLNNHFQLDGIFEYWRKLFQITLTLNSSESFQVAKQLKVV